MLHFLPPRVRGSLALTLVILNTMFWCVPLYSVTLLKLLLPIAAWRRFCTQVLTRIAENWISVNNWIADLVQRTEWILEGVAALSTEEWYLVVSNHRNWLDIVVLQRAFNRRIPFLKFFTKQELIWFPILGLAWWALDFPFMKRYSREKLRQHPELRGKDLETTRKMCARFQDDPVSIINFLEGTRFSPEKHAAQASPYRYLLKPKAGGIAFALAAMDQKIHTMLNVTLVYPDGYTSFWEFLQGLTPRIVVHVDKIDIPQYYLMGDYANDPVFREQFQKWVRDLWAEKDEVIADLLESYAADTRVADQKRPTKRVGLVKNR